MDGSKITKVVDVRGFACPIPVVKTKKALEEARGGASEEASLTVITLVDSDVAAQNVSRMAQNAGYEVSVKREGPDYRVIIEGKPSGTSPAPKGMALPEPSEACDPSTVTPASSTLPSKPKPSPPSEPFTPSHPRSGLDPRCSSLGPGADAGVKSVFVISSDRLGTGEEELGTALMSSFLFALSNVDNPPSTLIFVNRGIYITTEGTRHGEALGTFSSKGVRIISCGTCLDYYHLKDRLVFGVIGNMYEIVEEISNARKVIWI